MFYKIATIVFFSFFSFSTNAVIVNNPVFSVIKITGLSEKSNEINFIYNNLKTNVSSLPNKESFAKALQGFYELKEKGLIKKDILTLIDFSLSSIEKRLWIIDLKTNTVIYNSLVAHGRNSGNEYAQFFSNKVSSFKSSIGFFATGETYIGKHGYSLRLDGLNKGINCSARERAIVIHGAEYVSNSFINQTGRLGRSLGCPSLPKQISKEVIDIIKNKSLLYIYYPNSRV
ncbi:murein L,D-transpeptidase catalytic domain family protein [Lutibacter sp.]|uniref:murein L,D-transpeptidase catalytic domain family protein n=1 Tax=Lutibacter sp. TaxID=1925666 RepID=UPI002735CC5C|nr:murein L,D-transpeptidase catalytic domain family protein [Lutibacter sp.]MDP3312083.1 murein L,D-transpeptidase catalytic domain family protein [Lutibacter sp.]